jgi:hypothetical protein
VCGSPSSLFGAQIAALWQERGQIRGRKTWSFQDEGSTKKAALAAEVSRQRDHEFEFQFDYTPHSAVLLAGCGNFRLLRCI